MNTQLIADAVRNSRGRDEATVWDKLFSFWVSATGLHPDMGRSGSRSRGTAATVGINHRYDFIGRVQCAVLSHGTTGAGVRGRSQ